MKRFAGYVALFCVLSIPSLSFGADDAANLYQKSCASCHGNDGSGNTNAHKKMNVPDLRDKQFVEMTDSQLFETIGRGKNHREYPHTFLYTGMTEEQVKSLVAHIRKLQKAPK